MPIQARAIAGGCYPKAASTKDATSSAFSSSKDLATIITPIGNPSGDVLALRESAAKRYDRMLAETPGIERPPIELSRRVISWFVYAVRLPLTEAIARWM